MRVGAAVLLDEGFTAAGTVSLNSARADRLVLSPAKLAGANEITFNFTATEAQIAGELRWAPDGRFSGRVNLEDASVGELDDNWSERAGRPTGAGLPAGGFASMASPTAGLVKTRWQRLEWIRSQYERGSTRLRRTAI